MSSTSSSPQKILLAQTAFIGDVILATSLVEKLHAHFPQAQLDLLVRKGNEALVKGHPHLRKCWVWDKQAGKYKSLLPILKAVRRERYDWIINLQRFATSGFFTALSKAKHKIGFDKNPASLFFDIRHPHSFESIHETERNTELIASLTTPEVFMPKLYPSESDFQTVKTYQEAPYLCLSPTSVWFTKQFPKEKWVEFIAQVPFAGNIFLLGAPSDRQACEEILEQAGRSNVTNLAGSLSLLQSAALMQKAVLNYTNDSAPMHLASAMNAPTCAIYCSTVPSFGFGPLAQFSKVVEIQSPLDCRPCGIHGKKACPEGHFKCGFAIEIAQLNAVLELAQNWNA